MRPRAPFFLSLLLTVPLLAGTIDVTTTADSGPGSLRQAIETANTRTCGEPCVIAFRIPGPVPESGHFTIRPQSLLPFITAPDVMIDGSTQKGVTGDTNPFGPEIEIDGTNAGWGPGLKYVRTNLGVIRGLAINRFEGNGIVVDGSSGAHVLGNFVGMDPTGRFARPNGANGILFIRADRALVAGNTVGGNRGNGIFFHFSNGTIEQNNIGFGRSAAFRIPNGAHGIDVNAQVAIWDNHIAYNALHGILAGPLARGPILRNRIHRNGLLSIENNGGPSAPVITFARATSRDHFASPGEVIVRGSLHAKPQTLVDVHIYAAPHRNEFGLAEANVLIASAQVLTDVNGDAQFANVPQSGLVPNGWVTATATTHEGTSELGEPFPLVSDAVEVTTTRDEGEGSLHRIIEIVNARACSDEEPCWIDFHVPEDQLTNGVAVFEPRSPLPPITNAHVYIDGSSQTWYTGDRVEGHEVEIRGAHAGAGANGVQFGTESTPAIEAFLRDVTVSGFGGDGIRAFLSTQEIVDFVLDDTASSSNANGVVISGTMGSTFSSSSRARIAGGIFSGNRGEGLRLSGRWYSVEDANVLDNGGNGIYGGSRSFVRIGTSVVARNGANGIVSAPDAIAMFIDARTFSNGALGIDRKDDGVSAIDETDHVTDAPEILSAEYDAARGITVVRGRTPTSIPSFDIAAMPDQQLSRLQFFVSSEAGEGEAYSIQIQHEGNEFVAELPGDRRGRYVTATRTVQFCTFEFGCVNVDTSEYSNAVQVE